MAQAARPHDPDPAPEKKKPGRPGKNPAEAENERLRKENEKLAAKLSKTEGRPGDHGKSTRALGNALRERGLRKRIRRSEERVHRPGSSRLPLKQRHAASSGNPGPPCGARKTPADPRKRKESERAPHPAALSEEEREQVLDVLDSDRFADKSPAQAWAVLLDEGCYYCSIRTMYRVLASRDEVRDRRAQAAHPPRVRPELVADGPDQVWTWDITKLKSEWRGVYFDLYVMIDIYSRKVIHWEVHATENGDLAREFIENAVKANGERARNTFTPTTALP